MREAPSPPSARSCADYAFANVHSPRHTLATPSPPRPPSPSERRLLSGLRRSSGLAALHLVRAERNTKVFDAVVHPLLLVDTFGPRPHVEHAALAQLLDRHQAL